MDRRPIGARRLKIVHRLSGALARAGVSPNAISVAGVVAAVIAGGLLVFSNPARTGIDVSGSGVTACLIVASVLIPFRLLCNLLDGLVAVEGGRRSALGDVFNEVPDRIADIAVLVGAGYVAGASVTLGWCAACLAVLVAYVRSFGKSLGFASDYRGPMAKQQRMVVVVIGALWVALAPEAWQEACSIVCESSRSAYGGMAIALGVICAGCVITFARRLWRICVLLRERGLA